MQFSQRALCLQRPHPPTIGFAVYFNCHVNEWETPKTCLTNHKGSISHHITPLVINSLRGGHTNTHTHTHTHTQAYRHCRQKQFQEASHMLTEGQHATGLKSSCQIN